MPKFDLHNQEAKKIGNIELNDSVFAVEVNLPLVHQVIKAQRAAVRSGTAKTKTKSEVRGGGRKPFKQKGTGNARQGSTRSPLQPGGGQSFGPIPRSYVQKTPKAMVKGALRSALSDRCQSQKIIMVDQFALNTPKTKPLASVLKAGFKVGKALVVDAGNSNLNLSIRNIPNVKYIESKNLNVYDIVKYEWLIMTKAALESIHERFAKAE